MGCCSSKEERVPDWEPAPRSVAPPRSRQVQRSSQPTTNNSHAPRSRPRLPRLRVPSGVSTEKKKKKDSVTLAMEIDPGCVDEESPTWIELSPLSNSLGTWRSWDRQEREEKENKDVKNIDRGLNIHCSTPTGRLLGDSRHPCVWNAEFVRGMTSGEVVIEARRRVRKFNSPELEDYKQQLDANPASQQSQPGHLPLKEAQEWEKLKREAEKLQDEIEALEIRIDKQKDEAMRRVMPLLRDRWTV
ncbi:hypothetical protein PG993_013726 [Apiospora rasikravindrae]|uniref:Uncharacterized protein n=1 Tax=Apiospora rasikravindrae TaxID=990691 RepID=A0ABR1RR13_9PEZI